MMIGLNLLGLEKKVATSTELITFCFFWHAGITDRGVLAKSFPKWFLSPEALQYFLWTLRQK